MSSGASVIADVLAGWEGDVHLEREVFATIEPEAIAAAVDDFCRSHLDAGVSRYEFFATSVGSVHGVRLGDGRRVVIKAYRADVESDHLLAVQRVQAQLSAARFPSPRPILGPTSLAHGCRSSAARRHIVGPGAAFALQIVGLAVAEPERL